MKPGTGQESQHKDPAGRGLAQQAGSAPSGPCTAPHLGSHWPPSAQHLSSCGTWSGPVSLGIPGRKALPSQGERDTGRKYHFSVSHPSPTPAGKTNFKHALQARAEKNNEHFSLQQWPWRQTKGK